MKIELGNTYRTKEGYTAKIKGWNNSSGWPARGDLVDADGVRVICSELSELTWTEEGIYSSTGKAGDDFDLISEVRNDLPREDVAKALAETANNFQHSSAAFNAIVELGSKLGFTPETKTTITFK